MAEDADGVERERLWQRFAKLYEGYRAYEKRTDRRIPVVVLKPREVR